MITAAYQLRAFIFSCPRERSWAARLWYSKTRNMWLQDQHCAAVEVQRCCRGLLARSALKKRIKRETREKVSAWPFEVFRGRSWSLLFLFP
jgi:hypothetical protein